MGETSSLPSYLSIDTFLMTEFQGARGVGAGYEHSGSRENLTAPDSIGVYNARGFGGRRSLWAGSSQPPDARKLNMQPKDTPRDISRRKFLSNAGFSGAGLAILQSLNSGHAAMKTAARKDTPPLRLFVSPHGDDRGAGTWEEPLATIQKARDAVRSLKATARGPIEVVLLPGTYYVGEPLTFRPEDSGSPEAPITYRALENGTATISGGKRLNCAWRPFRDGIYVCDLPEAREGKIYFSELYINGKRQIRARYPNGDSRTPQPAGYIRTTGAKRLSPADEALATPKCDPLLASCPPRFSEVYYDPKTFTQKHWEHPEDAVLFVFQRVAFNPVPFYSGQWHLRGIDRRRNALQLGPGGWQQLLFHYMQAYHPGIYEDMPFYVENVFEELDAPGEWYLDRRAGKLYYMPAVGVDLRTAVVEPALLQQVLQIKGTRENPVRHLSLRGLRIANAASTYFEAYSPAGMGDYTIHRGGAMFLEGAEDITVDRCAFDGVSGNGFFVNRYARRVTLSNSRLTDIGESGICFTGKQLYREDKRFRDPGCGFLNWWGWDAETEEIPMDCEARNNLVHDVGVFAKQCAGLFLATCARIKITHNHIYNTPRAGINLNDGRYGGHLFEFNEIHDTVRETADHGPLNSYGRDPRWCQHVCHPGWLPTGWPDIHGHEHHSFGSFEEIAKYARETTIIRNNRFSASRLGGNPRPGLQFGIDLDDGSANYNVFDNLCVGLGVKTKEGVFINIHGNVIINAEIRLIQANADNHVKVFDNTLLAGPDVESLEATYVKRGRFGLTAEFPVFLRD